VCKAPLTFTQHLALTTQTLKRQLMDGKLRDRRELASVKERIHHLDAALKQTCQDLVSAKYAGDGAKQEELKRKVLMLISQMKHKIYHEYIPERVPKERQCEVLGEIVREELDRDPKQKVSKEVSQEPLQR
jgi:hypothetical protein